MGEPGNEARLNVVILACGLNGFLTKTEHYPPHAVH